MYRREDCLKLELIDKGTQCVYRETVGMTTGIPRYGADWVGGKKDKIESHGRSICR